MRQCQAARVGAARNLDGLAETEKAAGEAVAAVVVPGLEGAEARFSTVQTETEATPPEGLLGERPGAIRVWTVEIDEEEVRELAGEEGFVVAMDLTRRRPEVAERRFLEEELALAQEKIAAQAMVIDLQAAQLEAMTRLTVAFQGYDWSSSAGQAQSARSSLPVACVAPFRSTTTDLRDLAVRAFIAFPVGITRSPAWH